MASVTAALGDGRSALTAPPEQTLGGPIARWHQRQHRSAALAGTGRLPERASTCDWGGGREHAIVRALAADPDVSELHAAPGNPGIASLARTHGVSANDPADVVRLAKRLGADLVVIGPEAPLVAGVADALRARGIAAFGPDAAAARIEGSKAFAKDVMAAAGHADRRGAGRHDPG